MRSKSGVQKAGTTKSKAIVGLDLSYTSTGLAVYWPHDDERTKLSLVVTTLKRWPKLMERQRFIVRHVMSLIAAHCAVTTPLDWVQKIEAVVMEGYAYNQKCTRLADLAELSGLVKQAVLSKTKKQPVIVAPTTLKKFVMGSGSATKAMMLLSAYTKFKRKFSSDDLCDAYGLARLGEAIFQPPPDGLYKYEMECVKTVRESNNLVGIGLKGS